MSVAQYESRLHDALAALRSAIEHQDARSATVARHILEGIHHVSLGGGRTISPETGSVARSIAGSPDSWARAAHRISRVEALVRGSHRSGARADAATSLRSILAEPQFHPHQTWYERLDMWINDQIGRLIAWIGEQLARALSPLPHPSSGFNLSSILIAIIFLAAIAAGIYLLAHGALRRSVHSAAVSESNDPVTVAAAQREAHQAEAAGDYRSALRYLFLALLLELQERGLLELRPGATNREYLRQLDDRPDLHERLGPPLHGLTSAFDRAWYGHIPVQDEEFVRCQGLAREIRDRMNARPAA